MKKWMLTSVFVGMAMVTIILWWRGPAYGVDQAVIDAAKKEGKFVHYTSMPIEPAMALLNAFKGKYPFLDTSQWYRGNSYNTYTRINTEMSAGQYMCDVSHVAIFSVYKEWKKKGWLMRYDSPAYDGYPKEVTDPGFYAPLRASALIMAYNTDALKGKEIPTTWAELAHPKWKDQIGVEDVDSGSQHIMYYCLRAVLGKDYWPKVGLNKPKIYPGTGAMINGLLRGEIKIAMLSYCYVVYDYRELRKAPIQGIWPKEGVPMAPAPIGIMTNAPHTNASKLFMEWIISKEGQTEMVNIVGAYSMKQGVSSAKGNPQWGSFKTLYVDDWDRFDADTEDWQKFWKEITRK